VLGVIGLAVFFALGWARKVVSEVKMLVFGFILITVGLAVVALSDVTGYRKIQVFSLNFPTALPLTLMPAP